VFEFRRRRKRRRRMRRRRSFNLQEVRLYLQSNA